MANVELDPAPPEKRPDTGPKPRTSAADAASIPTGPNPANGATQEGRLV